MELSDYDGAHLEHMEITGDTVHFTFTGNFTHRDPAPHGAWAGMKFSVVKDTRLDKVFVIVTVDVRTESGHIDSASWYMDPGAVQAFLDGVANFGRDYINVLQQQIDE